MSMTMTIEKVYTKDEIVDLLQTPNGVLRGMLAIYQYQTEFEKSVHTTTESNGVGFNGCDAEILTSFSEQLIKKKPLSQKQYNIAYKKMQKYAGQLQKIANKQI